MKAIKRKFTITVVVSKHMENVYYNQRHANNSSDL